MEETLTKNVPHNAILHEDTLDVILSFLSKWSRLKARLVCRKWNSRLLSRFHKRSRFNFNYESQKETVMLIISSADKRILTSLYELTTDEGPMLQDMVAPVLNHFYNTGILGNVRVMTLNIEEPELQYLIGVINKRGFLSLEKLTLKSVENPKTRILGKSKLCLAVPGTLPSLLSFHSSIDYCDTEYPQMATTLQSIVNAAPKLESVMTLKLLDLSGRRVKILDFFVLEEDKGIVEMIHSVRESLTCLTVDWVFPLNPTPVFPNLTTLCSAFISESGDKTCLNLNPLPKLRKVTIPFCCIPFKELSKHLFPTGSLQHINVKYIPEPEDTEWNLESLQTLLNAGVPYLSFSEGNPPMNSLLDLLDFVEIDRPLNGKKSGVLEFVSVFEGINGETGREFLDWGPRILEKLGEKFEMIRFSELMFQNESPWNEIDVPLFGGRKMGRMRKIYHEDCLGDPVHTVSLAIIE